MVLHLVDDTVGAELLKIVASDRSLTTRQESVDLLLPAADEGTVEKSRLVLVLLVGGAGVPVRPPASRLLVLATVVLHLVELASALKDQPVERAVLPNLQLALVRAGLALVHAAHVTAQPLAIFEVNLAYFTLVHVGRFSDRISSLVLLSRLGLPLARFGWHGSDGAVGQSALTGLRVLPLGRAMTDLSLIQRLVFRLSDSQICAFDRELSLPTDLCHRHFFNLTRVVDFVTGLCLVLSDVNLLFLDLFRFPIDHRKGSVGHQTLEKEALSVVSQA